MTINQVEKICEYCCNKLDLPKIRIKILDDGIWAGSFAHNGNDFYIEIFLARILNTSIKEANELIWDFYKYKPKYKWEYLFYTIAHEIGHYNQYINRPKWLAKEALKINKYINQIGKMNISIKKYRSYSIEKDADNTAIKLLKQARKEKFKP
jgi:hypothetical protein